MSGALPNEKRYYAAGMGYTQLYLRPKPGGKEGEVEQRSMQFAHYPAGTVRHTVSGVIVEQHHFCQYATSDPVEQRTLELTIDNAKALGGSVIMLEDEFLKRVAALKLRMEPGAAEAMIDHNNTLLRRVQLLEAKEAMKSAAAGKRQEPEPDEPAAHGEAGEVEYEPAEGFEAGDPYDVPVEQEPAPVKAATSVASVVARAKTKPAPKVAVRR